MNMFILQRADHKKRLDRCYSPGGLDKISSLRSQAQSIMEQ